jgi:hypothetical protein
MDGALSPWARACRFLPENDLIPLAEARERLESGRAQLWLGDRSAGVTEIADDGRLHIMLAGGAMSELLDMLPSVEAFARAHACPAVYLGGRRGWRRVFLKFGYAFDGEDMVKKL